MNNRTDSLRHRQLKFLRVAPYLLSLLATNAAAADVAVSIGGEIKPGVYGRIDFGTRPPPPLLYPQPIFGTASPRQVGAAQPVYMHVPPGHAKNWPKHCNKYAACGQPVLFVKSPDDEHSHEKNKGKGKSKQNAKE